MIFTRSRTRKPVLAPACLVWLMGLTLICCGVKGPPKPPDLPSVPAVVALSVESAESMALLSWSLARPLLDEGVEDAFFTIYQSQRRLDAPTCEDCPRRFEKAMTVAYTDTHANRYAARVPVVAGYSYTFTVRLETANGVGADAGPVSLDVFLPTDETDPRMSTP